VGYYQPASIGQSPGPEGPAGPDGSAGSTGAPGPAGPSAQTVGRVGEPISTTLLAGATPLTWAAMAKGHDGNPVIAVADTDGNRLNALACLDSKCTTHLDTVVDPALDGLPTTSQPGGFTSIAIGVDGNPVIAYQSDESVKVAVCSSPTCSGAATISTVFAGPTNLAMTSIAIRPDGTPIIAFGDFDGVTSELVVVSCVSPDCSTSTTAVVPTGGSATSPDVAIRASGLPVIAYTDATNGDLDMFSCATGDCTSGGNATVFATGVTGWEPSLAIGIAGNPVIAFRDLVGSTRVAICRTADCTTGADTRSVAGYTATPDLALDPAGRPVLVARRSSPGEVHILSCVDAACALAATDVLQASGVIGSGDAAASIVVGDDGNPVVAWPQLSDNSLRVTACGNPLCSPFVGVG